MAEIILPPEENEETPQAPELNIDKPTENSKVITIEFEAKKTNKVSTKDTNQQLYTTDTDAWFEFKETTLENANGTYSAVFRNRYDGSIFQRTGDVVDGVAYYKIPEQEIRHAGKWRGQLVYTLSNGDTTAREFDYNVKGHILDGKDVREIVVEDFETLMLQLRSMKDNAEQELADLVNTSEQNETDRQAFFDDLVEDIDELQTNYQELLDTGVLQTNINEKLEELEEEYAPKLTEVTAQLAQNEKELAKKPDRNETSWATLNTFDEATRGIIQGLDPSQINAVLGYKNVQPENASFFVRGRNLFNKNTATLNAQVNPANGELQSVTGYFASDFIPVDEQKTYTRSHEYRMAFYDSQKNYISGISAEEDIYTFETPSGTKFIRVSDSMSNIDTYQVERGEQSTSYTPFVEYIPKEFTEKHDIQGEDLEDGSIPPEKTTFVSRGKNLFNKETVTTGRYVNQENGAIQENSGHWLSDFIQVEEAENYVLNATGGLRVGFYDTYKTFISGEAYPEMPIKIPSDAHFIRFSITISNDPEEVQFERGEEVTLYEPFGVKIPKLITKVGEGDNTNEVEINLPSKLYALVGEEMNVYFENIINGRDTDYEFDVTCTVGKHYQNFFRVIPESGDDGTYPIKIDVYKEGKIIATGNSEIIVSSQSAGEGITRSIIKIGDSTTDGGSGINKLVENFENDVMAINPIGTRGTAPNLHEGRSGWRATTYTSTGESSGTINAFWNPTTEEFDFGYYLESNNLEMPNYVFINLGVNDMFNYGSDNLLQVGMNQALDGYNKMVSSIRDFDSNIKIVLGLTIPPNYSQDAFGEDYSTDQNRNRYKRNNFYWVKKLIEVYDNRESENIYITPLFTNLDTRYNMGLVESQVNARNTLKTTMSAKNSGVHPSTSGYWQIADVEWFFLKSLEV